MSFHALKKNYSDIRRSRRSEIVKRERATRSIVHARVPPPPSRSSSLLLSLPLSPFHKNSGEERERRRRRRERAARSGHPRLSDQRQWDAAVVATAKDQLLSPNSARLGTDLVAARSVGSRGAVGDGDERGDPAPEDCRPKRRYNGPGCFSCGLLLLISRDAATS